MARVAFSERPSTLKVLGIGFIALMLFFVWLTYAFFNKTFVSTDDVTVLTSNAGQNLPKNADVKLRGMIVGSVKEIEPSKSGTGVEITVGLKPDLIDRVPEDVTARIVPKTLFGEKYIALIAPKNPSSEHLRAGDTIQRAVVPIEVEDLLNDLYPLLKAVDPEELSYTLSAVSSALEGRGEKLGRTLVQANDYLEAINPEVPQLVDDVIKLGDVSDQYADEMPRIARTLNNTVFTGNTIVAKRAQLASFFDEGTRLADTLTTFTRTNGDNLVKLAANGSEVLDVSAQYSSVFPCFLGAMAKIMPRLDSVFRNQTVHINLRTLAEQPSGYSAKERASVPPQAEIDALAEADPRNTETRRAPANRLSDGGRGQATVPVGLGAVCKQLAAYSRGEDPLDGHIYPGPNPSVYELVGLKNSHNNKFGSDDDFKKERAAVDSGLASSGYFAPSLAATDSPSQRKLLKAIVANQADVASNDVPDAAAIMLSPVLRGSAVTQQ